MRRRRPKRGKARRRARSPKTKYHCHVHAQRKARDRLGLHLTMEDLDAMVAKIQSNGAAFIGRESNTRSAWVLEWEGVTMKVVYHSGLKAIATIMSMDMLTRVEGFAA
jgi:hypothetical protein